MRIDMRAEAVEAILDSIDEGVFTVDRDWRIQYWNRAAEEITGFRQDQAMGQTCYELLKSEACRSLCPLRHTLESNKALHDVANKITTHDGREHSVRVSTALLRDRSGQVIGAAETMRDLSAVESLRKRLRKSYTFHDIVSKNERMQALFEVLPDIARAESSVLIQGPSGSGKELFARALHDLSPRHVGPFVAVNCGALPDTLLESELFGYRKGAFTDARRDKPGRFDVAKGGTLFLDEIGDISQALQVKLLRVLQERTFLPLGARDPVHADVRVVTATNRNLRDEVDRGHFRDDLYYRLNVVRLELPSLKARKEDIPLLVDHFVVRFNAEQGRSIRGLTQRASQAVLGYDFPGNVRELENAIEHAFVLCRSDRIDVCCLPPEVRGPVKPYTPCVDDGFNPLKAAEAEAIRQTLARFDGHRLNTARALGIHKATLLRKMKKLGIEYP